MTELSAKAHELTRAARCLDYPTVLDRERIERALRVRLGVSSFDQPSPAPTTSALRAVGITWPLASTVVGAALVITVSVLGAMYLFKGNIELASGTPASRLAPIASSPTVSDETAPKQPPPTTPAASSDAPAAGPRQRVPNPGPTSDRLAQEVALMTRATSNLRAHRALQALQVLDEYQRLFPSGLLNQERHAARAQALCELNRPTEARADIALLEPRSPAAARATQACHDGSARAQ